MNNQKFERKVRYNNSNNQGNRRNSGGYRQDQPKTFYRSDFKASEAGFNPQEEKRQDWNDAASCSGQGQGFRGHRNEDRGSGHQGQRNQSNYQNQGNQGRNQNNWKGNERGPQNHSGPQNYEERPQKSREGFPDQRNDLQNQDVRYNNQDVRYSKQQQSSSHRYRDNQVSKENGPSGSQNYQDRPSSSRQCFPDQRSDLSNQRQCSSQNYRQDTQNYQGDSLGQRQDFQPQSDYGYQNPNTDYGCNQNQYQDQGYRHDQQQPQNQDYRQDYNRGPQNTNWNPQGEGQQYNQYQDRMTHPREPREECWPEDRQQGYVNQQQGPWNQRNRFDDRQSQWNQQEHYRNQDRPQFQGGPAGPRQDHYQEVPRPQYGQQAYGRQDGPRQEHYQNTVQQQYGQQFQQHPGGPPQQYHENAVPQQQQYSNPTDQWNGEWTDQAYNRRSMDYGAQEDHQHRQGQHGQFGNQNYQGDQQYHQGHQGQYSNQDCRGDVQHLGYHDQRNCRGQYEDRQDYRQDCRQDSRPNNQEYGNQGHQGHYQESYDRKDQGYQNRPGSSQQGYGNHQMQINWDQNDMRHMEDQFSRMNTSSDVPESSKGPYNPYKDPDSNVYKSDEVAAKKLEYGRERYNSHNSRNMHNPIDSVEDGQRGPDQEFDRQSQQQRSFREPRMERINGIRQGLYSEHEDQYERRKKQENMNQQGEPQQPAQDHPQQHEEFQEQQPPPQQESSPPQQLQQLHDQRPNQERRESSVNYQNRHQKNPDQWDRPQQNPQQHQFNQGGSQGQRQNQNQQSSGEHMDRGTRLDQGHNQGDQKQLSRPEKKQWNHGAPQDHRQDHRQNQWNQNQQSSSGQNQWNKGGAQNHSQNQFQKTEQNQRNDRDRRDRRHGEHGRGPMEFTNSRMKDQQSYGENRSQPMDQSSSQNWTTNQWNQGDNRNQHHERAQGGFGNNQRSYDDRQNFGDRSQNRFNERNNQGNWNKDQNQGFNGRYSQGRDFNQRDNRQNFGRNNFNQRQNQGFNPRNQDDRPFVQRSGQEQFGTGPFGQSQGAFGQEGFGGGLNNDFGKQGGFQQDTTSWEFRKTEEDMKEQDVVQKQRTSEWVLSQASEPSLEPANTESETNESASQNTGAAPDVEALDGSHEEVPQALNESSKSRIRGNSIADNNVKKDTLEDDVKEIVEDCLKTVAEGNEQELKHKDSKEETGETEKDKADFDIRSLRQEEKDRWKTQKAESKPEEETKSLFA